MIFAFGTCIENGNTIEVSVSSGKNKSNNQNQVHITNLCIHVNTKEDKGAEPKILQERNKKASACRPNKAIKFSNFVQTKSKGLLREDFRMDCSGSGPTSEKKKDFTQH